MGHPHSKLFETREGGAPGMRRVEGRSTTVTTKGDEVETVGLLETDESPRHGRRLRS
jgi:hypothetical protein